MNRNMQGWPEIEQRLRREPASPPPAADAVPRLLRAVRMAAPEQATHAGARSAGWWLGAAIAAALAVLLTVQRPALESPPVAVDAPVAPGAVAGWSLAALDAAAAAPLQQEWTGLRQDLQAVAGFMASCLPTPGSLPPQG